MKIFHVDAFTTTPFTGNPAGICLMDEARSDEWMQHIAAEMNLSETAFVEIRPRATGFPLRWFTPKTEVSLCGHATLATAHILWEQGIIDSDQQAQFHTRSGVLAAGKRDGWIELDFPLRKVRPAGGNRKLTEALGVDELKYKRLGKSEMIGFQASARTGVVRCRLNKDRVMLCGKAITIMRGEVI